ncbi:GH25 family lysozyme [Methylovirgula sp. 4M-Z18]|uniref:GH25 family lysozyme n=1 Tax=Methylovirgula sp. 4M-Z18 TaxID=2293567 RepID=UPI000E2FC6EA|nr:GH25 family lysozyme [Methylovirgula sp. 4M-Z18]RFB80694.1 lysozyme [Methylovirgula sp. 4M-Z18]
MGWLTFVIVMAGVLGGGLSAAFYYGWPLALVGQVVGVDVSHYQGDIDWPSLASSRVRFAYIKATEGSNLQDDHFQRNWASAAQAGVVRGAYHFFTLCSKAEDQAKNFIATVPSASDALPPMIDLETLGPCGNKYVMKDPVAEIAKLQKLLADKYGRQPVLYVTDEFERTYLQGQFDDKDIWVRSIQWPPNYRVQQWVIWQYHDHARRPGVATDLDLNFFRGGDWAFDAWRKGER